MSTFRKPKRLFNNATAPVGSIISEVGRGVAEAQKQLDASALESFRQLYGTDADASLSRELRQIGYIPTWYQIPETNAEINLTLTMGVSKQSGNRPSRQLLATTVDAGVQNQFDFQAELGSKVNFKVVPIPPPVTPQDTMPVPDLSGRTLEQALDTLQQLSLDNVVYDGNREQDHNMRIVDQSPAPGSLISPDDPIELFTA